MPTGIFLTNHVVGVSKEDIRERYGSGLDIKRITQVDIAIDVMQPWTVTSPCKCRVRKIKASRTGGSNERATRK